MNKYKTGRYSCSEYVLSYEFSISLKLLVIFCLMGLSISAVTFAMNDDLLDEKNVMGNNQIFENGQILVIENTSFVRINAAKIYDNPHLLSEKLQEVLAFEKDRLWGNEVLYHQGDVRLSTLSIGNKPSNIVAYIIDGNLIVDRIIDSDPDIAIALAISGDLEADYISAGGNFIHVGGDLKVNGIFYGFYNHGELFVDGKSTASVSIIDDYSGVISSVVEIENEYFEDESSEEEKKEAQNEMSSWLLPEFFITNQLEIEDAHQWSDLLDQYKISQAILYNQPVLQSSFIEKNNIKFLSQPSQEAPEHVIIEDWKPFLEGLGQYYTIDQIAPIHQLIAGLSIDPAYIFGDPWHESIEDYYASFSFRFKQDKDYYFHESISIWKGYQGALPFSLDFNLSKDQVIEKFNNYLVVEEDVSTEESNRYDRNRIELLIDGYKILLSFKNEQLRSIYIEK